VFSPIDLGGRAAPSLALEQRPIALGEFPVKAGVVCAAVLKVVAAANFGIPKLPEK
jgi:hypothetical protein